MPRKNNPIDYEIKPGDRLLDFLPLDKDWPEKPQMPSAIMTKFKEKINEIYKAGYDHHLCLGEIHLMLDINFGYFKRNIPWGKMEETKQWIINNWWRNYQILEPQKHNILMQSDNDYSRNFKSHEKSFRNDW